MSAQQTITSLYDIVGRAVPSATVALLRFLDPDCCSKPRKRLDIMRGRILGQSTGHIWDPKWCFFEIGIGSYGSHPYPNRGGVGFLSFPDNKECGGGLYRKDILRILTGFVH